ncbi:P-loop containing nucleoside triphosphate hydrolase protein [Gorgonomyces haynaldii]|nr:P-loop containing nucleoside triphosphate hydrolase protein [Gorgonomyces haynaldii]
MKLFHLSANELVSDERSWSGRPVSDVGYPYQQLFKFQHFNPMQSQCLDVLLNDDVNVAISSPTGSGKTVLMELAILRLVRRNRNFRVVYLAPLKALCTERALDWKAKFQPFQIVCEEFTGDTENQLESIKKAQIIVTTPEKWDFSLRRWREDKSVVQSLQLVLIDEVHFVNEPGRGATLEAVVSRMKLASRTLDLAHCLRFVAVSATIPNLEDIAEWLSFPPKIAFAKAFGPEYRPVPLEIHVQGFPGYNNPYLFDSMLNDKLFHYVQQYSNGKPTLVFCATRKSTLQAADKLSQAAGSFFCHQNGSRLMQMARSISDKKLSNLVSQGIAYHHAGLELPDRRIVEDLFLQGQLMVVCSTSTLAVGVNLPAHLVIVKGTSKYVDGKTIPYSNLDLLQMIGRAGRPQYDSFGQAVILSMPEEVQRCHNLVHGEERIESNLHQHLIENVNAEIVLGTVTNLDEAMLWLRSTFLYVRIKRNPSFYRLDHCSAEEGRLSAEKRLEAIFLKDIDLLAQNKIVLKQDRFSPTAYGKIMSKHCISFDTMSLFVQASGKPLSMREMLELFCKAKEFAEMRFRQDKAILNNMNKHPNLRFKLKGKVSTVDQKIFLLIQAVLSNVPLAEKKQTFSMTQEANLVMKTAERLCGCDWIDVRSLASVYGSKSLFVTLALHLALSIDQMQNLGGFSTCSYTIEWHWSTTGTDDG